MAKSVIEKLLALSDQLDKELAAETDARVQKALSNVEGALSHLRDALAQTASVTKPGHPRAKNARRKQG